MIEPKYDTFWERLLAMFVDGLIFWPFRFVDNWFCQNHTSISRGTLLAWSIIYPLLVVTYSVVMHGKYGQTLGKMATKVKVVDISESPLSMSQALRRDSIPIILILLGTAIDGPKILSGSSIIYGGSFHPGTPFYVVLFYFIVGVGCIGWSLSEIVTMLFSRKRRALHDFIARSVVIRCADHPENR